MYHVKNRININQADNIIQTLKLIAAELHEWRPKVEYTPSQIKDDGPLTITASDGNIIDFGRLSRYPHCYDYRPGEYDINSFIPYRWLMGEQLTYQEATARF